MLLSLPKHGKTDGDILRLRAICSEKARLVHAHLCASELKLPEINPWSPKRPYISILLPQDPVSKAWRLKTPSTKRVGDTRQAPE